MCAASTRRICSTVPPKPSLPPRGCSASSLPKMRCGTSPPANCFIPIRRTRRSITTPRCASRAKPKRCGASRENSRKPAPGPKQRATGTGWPWLSTARSSASPSRCWPEAAVRQKRRPQRTAFLVFRSEPKSARIELDHQVRFHCDGVGHLVELRHTGEGHLVGAVDRDIVWNLALGQALRLDDQRHFLGLVAQAHHIARQNLAAGDVALHAVHTDVPVADDLTCGEDGRCELGAIDDHVEALFEQTDQVLAGVALHGGGLLVGRLELLLGHVAVIALELLLCPQLQAIVAHLALAALAVLARAIGPAVHRGRRAAPDVLAHAAVEFMLGALALRHASYSNLLALPPKPFEGSCASTRT